jgi:tetratricopeptide (TPR) repeat protein
MILRFWLFWTVAALAGCATVAKQDKDRAALHLQIGTGYLSKGQYPQAIGELQKAEALDATNPYIFNNLGLAYFVRGKYKEAEGKFREAIRLAKHYSDAKNNLARVMIETKRYPEAIRILNEVEGDLTYANPEKTQSNLGMAYFEMGQYQKAEEYLSRSLSMRRDSCITSYFYGRTLLEMKRFKESSKALDQAIEFCRSTKFEEPIYYSATSYFSLGDREKSRARIEELLKDYPKSKYVAKAKGMLELLEQ